MKNNMKMFCFTKNARLFLGLCLTLTFLVGAAFGRPINTAAATKKPYLIEAHMRGVEKKVTGGAITIGATKELIVKRGSNPVKSIKVKSSDKKVATVKAASRTEIDIKGKSEGKATITVEVKTYQTAKGKEKYKTYKLKYVINVYDSSPFSNYVYKDGDDVCFDYTGTGDSSIIVPEGVTKIIAFREGDFVSNYDITYIYIPSTIKTICCNTQLRLEGDNNYYSAFYQCPNLKTVEGGNYSYRCNGSTVTRPGNITFWSNGKKDIDKNSEDDSSSKQTIYVISSINEDYFTYNSEGLITEEKTKWVKNVYEYREDNQLKKATSSWLSSEEWIDSYIYNYYYDENGRRSEIVIERNMYDGTMQTYLREYAYDSKGRMTDFYERKYKYSGERISKIAVYDTTYEDVEYDDKGNTSKRYEHLCTNSYKDGRIIKRVIERPQSSYGNPEEYVFTYKKIEVDKKYVDIIKQQQWALINDDLYEYFVILPAYVEW